MSHPVRAAISASAAIPAGGTGDGQPCAQAGGAALQGWGSAEPWGCCSRPNPAGAGCSAAFGAAPSRMERGCRDDLRVGGYEGRLSLPSAGLKAVVTRGQPVSLAQSPSREQLRFGAGSLEKLCLPSGASYARRLEGWLPPAEPAGLLGLIACGGRAPAAPPLPDSWGLAGPVIWVSAREAVHYLASAGVLKGSRALRARTRACPGTIALPRVWACEPKVHRAGSGLSAAGLPACSPGWGDPAHRLYPWHPCTPSPGSPRPALCPAPRAGLWSLSRSQY